jgi:ABC-2 type transport system permease protein
VRALRAQLRTELVLTLRNKESLLLTLGIPVGLLVFFSLVDVLPLDDLLGPGDEPVDVLAPGVLALAIVSMAMTGLAIATGFERSYGVLKRLGTTPLGRPRLLAAKIGAVVVVEAIQAAVLVPVALALGWEPSFHVVPLLGAVVLGTAAFAGLGLWMAGTLRAEITLALANGLYIVLLLLGGFVIPLSELPDPLRLVAEALPASALVDLVRAGFDGTVGPGRAWLVLAVWAVAMPLVAARTFRWSPAR